MPLKMSMWWESQADICWLPVVSLTDKRRMVRGVYVVVLVNNHVTDVVLAVLEQLKPNFCDAWSNLASAYMRKGMLQEAAECCRHALSLNPRLVRYIKRPS